MEKKPDLRRYPNLPPDQQFLQRVLDEFNAEEALWRSLEPNRKYRRRKQRRLSVRTHEALDMIEIAAARRARDCLA